MVEKEVDSLRVFSDCHMQTVISVLRHSPNKYINVYKGGRDILEIGEGSVVKVHAVES